jgi:hypothetical protein
MSTAASAAEAAFYRQQRHGVRYHAPSIGITQSGRCPATV